MGVGGGDKICPLAASGRFFPDFLASEKFSTELFAHFAESSVGCWGASDARPPDPLAASSFRERHGGRKFSPSCLRIWLSPPSVAGGASD